MRKFLLPAVAFACVIAFAPPSFAGSVSYHVAIVEFSFTPAITTVPVSTSIGFAFDNGGAFTHTATSDVGDFIDTGPILASTSGYAFLYGSGTFPFHCAVHPSLMKGTIRVRPRASKTSIIVGGSSTITYGNAFSKGVRWDLQRRYNGGAWVAVRTNTLLPYLVFNPTRAGTNDFRARTHDFAGHVSGWSPFRRVMVT